jgi:hypothetical protein
MTPFESRVPPVPRFWETGDNKIIVCPIHSAFFAESQGKSNIPGENRYFKVSKRFMDTGHFTDAIASVSTWTPAY